MDASQTQSQTQSTEAAVAHWRARYPINSNVHDEMFNADQSLRPHWLSFSSQLDQMDAEELARRWELGRRLIHENGVTYNVYGDPKGMDRPWELDSIPLLISADEWSSIESALIQRARLLNLLLADLYGPQALLRAGIFPPELVFSHPGFLRPCHGIRLPQQCHLNLYSADIARTPDGRWSILGDRTQAPSGAGYALENRIVLSRIFPEVFKHCNVQRLAMFFRKMRETMTALAPYNRDNPLIVLLTPGPYNETYFEHAYLARYLNYTLVEGGDLTVRDQCVYLKTLGGLHRVDVILRRLDAEFCDPLELRPDSTLGVPGLVHAVRAGNVAVANPLGSGLIETPAINSYLPALCRHLLGEDLKLPSVPSYWCGKASALQHAIANLERMVIKPVFHSPDIEPVFGARLSREQRETLIARIKAQPHRYVAQEQVALSTVPVLVKDQIQPRHAVVRTYLAAHDNSYVAMPGGLTQVPGSSDSLVFSLQRGGGSKDTWVQSDAPVSNFSLLRPANQPIELSRAGSDLPSRVADNLFWLGRYVERAESAVRLLRGIVVRLSEKSATGDVRELPALLNAYKAQRKGSSPAADAADELMPSDDLRYALDLSYGPGGMYATLQSLQGVARMVRDRLSNDTWRVIRSLDEDVIWPKENEHVHLSEMLAKLNYMIITLASFGGLASESMTRGQVWRFMDMGRRLERSVSVAGLLRSTLRQTTRDEPPLLEALLEICDSLMTYRRRYLASLQLAPVLDLLLADESNPRSVAFQLVSLDDHVNNLPRDKSQAQLSPEQRLTLSNLSMLRLIDIDSLSIADEEGRRKKLDESLERVDKDMTALSDLIARRYLSHAQTSRQLASLRSEVPE
jgi:uncharacterized circularly permuted ATP-grasp superfamily protein/uncharacterized alpha-E superfamily protein